MDHLRREIFSFDEGGVRISVVFGLALEEVFENVTESGIGE